METMTTLVQVVGVTFGGSEITLGPFNQGVVLEGGKLIDTATRQTIARMHGEMFWIGQPEEAEPVYFQRIFVQTVPA